MIEEEYIRGRDLKIGDTIKVWWNPQRDTVTGLEEYTGTYKNKEGWEGVRIVKFAILKKGMTLFPYEIFTKC